MKLFVHCAVPVSLIIKNMDKINYAKVLSEQIKDGDIFKRVQCDIESRFFEDLLCFAEMDSPIFLKLDYRLSGKEEEQAKYFYILPKKLIRLNDNEFEATKKLLRNVEFCEGKAPIKKMQGAFLRKVSLKDLDLSCLDFGYEFVVSDRGKDVIQENIKGSVFYPVWKLGSEKILAWIFSSNNLMPSYDLDPSSYLRDGTINHRGVISYPYCDIDNRFDVFRTAERLGALENSSYLVLSKNAKQFLMDTFVGLRVAMPILDRNSNLYSSFLDRWKEVDRKVSGSFAFWS